MAFSRMKQISLYLALHLQTIVTCMRYIYILVLCLLAVSSYGQQKQYKVGVVGFYNLENLFDTIKSPSNMPYTHNTSRV